MQQTKGVFPHIYAFFSFAVCFGRCFSYAICISFVAVAVVVIGEWIWSFSAIVIIHLLWIIFNWHSIAWHSHCNYCNEFSLNRQYFSYLLSTHTWTQRVTHTCMQASLSSKNDHISTIVVYWTNHRHFIDRQMIHAEKSALRLLILRFIFSHWNRHVWHLCALSHIMVNKKWWRH